MKQVYHSAQLSLFTKPCRVCGEEKDRITGFDTGKNKCKQCRAAHRRFRYHNPQPKPVPRSGYKFCTECHEEKPLEEFHKHKMGMYGCDATCKACKSEYNRVRMSTPEYKEYVRYKHQTPERKAYASAYYAANREMYRTIEQASRKAHPERARERYLRRKARKQGTIVENVNYEVILERDGWYCYICGQVIDPTAKPRSSAALVFDHKVPLIPRPNEPQGTHTADNIHTAHNACNVRKGNKPFETLTAWERRGI